MAWWTVVERVRVNPLERRITNQGNKNPPLHMHAHTHTHTRTHTYAYTHTCTLTHVADSAKGVPARNISRGRGWKKPGMERRAPQFPHLKWQLIFNSPLPVTPKETPLEQPAHGQPGTYVIPVFPLLWLKHFLSCAEWHFGVLRLLMIDWGCALYQGYITTLPDTQGSTMSEAFL